MYRIQNWYNWIFTGDNLKYATDENLPLRGRTLYTQNALIHLFFSPVTSVLILVIWIQM